MQITEAVHSHECIVILALLLWGSIFSITAAAQPISNKPYIVASITNDAFGGGLTRTYDDQRTLGFTVDAQFHVFGRIAQVNATYSALTNRYEVENAARLDNLELRARYPWWSRDETFILSAVGGAMLRGNLGGESIQDAYHDLINIDRVDLPYEGDNTFHGLVGLEARSVHKLSSDPGSPGLQLEGLADMTWLPSYAFEAGIFGGIAYGNAPDDKLSLHIGYQFNEADQNSVQQAVAFSERGFTFDLAMRLGFLTYGIQVFPGSSFALGSAGIALWAPGERHKLQSVDLVAEAGGLSNSGGMYLRFLYGLPSWDRERLNLELRYQFWTLSDALKRIDLAGHYRQTNIGAQYMFLRPGPKFQLIPYIGATVGLNTEKVYPTTGDGLINSGWTLLVSGELGLKLKLPAGFIHENCYYGLSGSYIYNLALASGASDSGRTYQTGESKGQAAVGVFVMIDF